MKIFLTVFGIVILLLFIIFFSVGRFVSSINKAVNEKDYDYLN